MHEDPQSKRLNKLLDQIDSLKVDATVATAAAEGRAALLHHRARLDQAAMLDGACQALRMAIDGYDGTPWPEYLERVAQDLEAQLAELAGR